MYQFCGSVYGAQYLDNILITCSCQILDVTQIPGTQQLPKCELTNSYLFSNAVQQYNYRIKICAVKCLLVHSSIT